MTDGPTGGPRSKAALAAELRRLLLAAERRSGGVGRLKRSALARAIGVSVEVHLLEEPAPGRYRFHDLLRTYVTELLDAPGAEEDLCMARRRLFDHYLYTAHAAARWIEPHNHPPPLPPLAAGARPREIPDYREATAWFERERPTLVRLLQQAAEAGYDTHAWQLAWCVGDFLYRNGYWRDDLVVQHAGLAAARRLGDRQAQASLHNRIGTAYGTRGRNQEALAHYRQAIELFDSLGNHRGEASAYLNLGLIVEREGDLREALSHSHLAYELFTKAGDLAGQARALNAIGWKHTLLGEHHQTLEVCHKALQIHAEVDDPLGAANAWDTLGYAYHRLGDFPQAVKCFRHALELFDRNENRHVRAQTLHRLGDVYADMGDRDAAQAAWREALDVFQTLGDGEAAAVAVKLKAGDRNGTGPALATPGEGSR